MPKLKKKGISSNPSQNGFPQPKKVNCFQCQTSFCIKFVISRLDYSQKNNWEYWTEQPKDKNKPICNACLRQIYQDKVNYWAAVQNSKKRALFRVYLHDGVI